MISAGDMAEATGLSRTPMREAMQELDKMGLINIYPQAGSQVSFLDYDKINESRAIRLSLELGVVEAVCERGLSERELDFFEHSLAAQEKSLARGDKNALMDLDDEYHRNFYVLAGRMMTHRVISDVQWHFDRVRRLSLAALDRIEIVKDHHEIIRVVKTGDKRAARKTVTSHLSRYLVDEKIIRAKYPEYFAT